MECGVSTPLYLALFVFNSSIRRLVSFVLAYHANALSSRLLRFRCHPEPGRPLMANGGEGPASAFR
jgi:hypothetical protein